MTTGKMFDLGRMRLSGNQSLPRGAIEAGVRVATGYPGVPVSDLQMSFEQLSGSLNGSRDGPGHEGESSE